MLHSVGHADMKSCREHAGTSRWERGSERKTAGGMKGWRRGQLRICSCRTQRKSASLLVLVMANVCSNPAGRHAKALVVKSLTSSQLWKCRELRRWSPQIKLWKCSSSWITLQLSNLDGILISLLKYTVQKEEESKSSRSAVQLNHWN